MAMVPCHGPGVTLDFGDDLDTAAFSLSMRVSSINDGGAFACDDLRRFHQVGAFEAVLGRILYVSVVTPSGKK
jgi:hypothetical protein